MNEITTKDTNVPMAVDQDLPDVNAEDDDQNKYLTFGVSGGIYGVGISGVKEIIEYPAVTRVPMTPPFIRGVINLRGNVVPVIDLAVRLDKSSQDISKRTCVIIVELQADGEDADVGFVVDSVNEVIDIPDAEIETAPAFGAEIRTDFISGMGKLNKDFVVLLDLDKVLAIEELSELSQSFAA